MADCGNDRLVRTHDRARDALFVERPQVFHGAAAARDDDHVDIGVAAEIVNALHDLKRRAAALHLSGIDEHVHRVVPPLQH